MKSDQEFYRRVVSDTLDSIVSPGVRDTLMTEALSLAGEISVPRRGRDFRSFVRGPLSETLERALGQELGRSVVAELTRLSEEAPASSVPPPHTKQAARSRPVASPHPRSEPQQAIEHPHGRRARSNQTSTVPPAAARAKVANAPTLPARPRREPQPEPEESMRARPPNSNDYPVGIARAFGMISSNPAAAPNRRLPIIFLATRDAELVRRFSSWLDPRASVVRVLRLADLLLHVEDAGDRKMVIVLDGQSPPLRVEALAALCEDLPAKLGVVLWGGTRDLTGRLTDLFPCVSDWLVCGDQTPLADVVDRCAQMVG